MLCVRLIYKPPVRGHDGRGRAHRDYSLSGFLITHTHTFSFPHSAFNPCVWTGLWRSESHAPPPHLFLSNRLSEAGAFLQFVPTSLLNHLHYLTVFPQRELQCSHTHTLSRCKSDESMHSRVQPGWSLLSVSKRTRTVGTHTHWHVSGGGKDLKWVLAIEVKWFSQK